MRTSSKRAVLVALLNVISLPLYAAEPATVMVSLAQTEKLTLENSSQYQAALNDAKAAHYRADALHGPVYPRLSIEGSYRYITVVPQLNVKAGPLAIDQKLGDNTNYSVGPTLAWTAFDGGAVRNSYGSAMSDANAKEQEAEAVKRQQLLVCRTLYFQLTLASEQLVVLSNSVNLSGTQYDDITKQVKAGAKSRIDQLSAHQELLSRQQQLTRAQADMAGALRELAALTGGTPALPGTCIPLDKRVSGLTLKDTVEPNIITQIDPVDDLLSRFSRYDEGTLWEAHPTLMEAQKLIESAHYAAAAADAAFWPRLQLTARTSLDYPNTMVLETINQNTLGANLSWSLFEGNADKDRAAGYRSQELSAQARREQIARGLFRDWAKAHDQLTALKRQRTMAAQAASEAGELAGISYRSYRAGALTYLELQTANYQVLEAELQLARVQIQLLINEAILASTQEGETTK